MAFVVSQIRNVLGINFHLNKSNANLLDQAGRKALLQWRIWNIPSCSLVSSSWLVFTSSVMFYGKICHAVTSFTKFLSLFDVLLFFFLLFRGSRADFLCEQVSCEHHHQQRPVHYSLRGSPRSHLFLFGFLASWLSQKEALHCSNNCCHPLHRVHTGKNTLGVMSRCKERAWWFFFFSWQITSTKLLDGYKNLLVIKTFPPLSC